MFVNYLLFIFILRQPHNPYLVDSPVCHFQYGYVEAIRDEMIAFLWHALELEESGAGLDKFCELVQREGSGLREVTGAVGLPDPLSDAQTNKAAELFTKELL